MIPVIEHCLVCDRVRQELHGKLILLGFLGICPQVDIGIDRLDQPTALTFLLLASTGDPGHSVSFEIVDEATGWLLASTSVEPLMANTTDRITLAPVFALTFGHAGNLALPCMIDGNEHYRAQFRVSAARERASVQLTA